MKTIKKGFILALALITIGLTSCTPSSLEEHEINEGQLSVDLTKIKKRPGNL